MATTTEFAHLKFLFNVTVTVRMTKKVLDAAMHYIESMRSDKNLWYKMQECYALTHQAKAIYDRAQAMQDFAIPQNIVRNILWTH